MAKTRVELVSPDAREVISLRIKEQRSQQRSRVFQRWWLTGALLFEQLNQRLFHRGDGILGKRIFNVARAAKEIQDSLRAVESLVLDALVQRTLLRLRCV